MATGEYVVHRSFDLAKLSNALFFLRMGRRDCFADFYKACLKATNLNKCWKRLLPALCNG